MSHFEELARYICNVHIVAKSAYYIRHVRPPATVSVLPCFCTHVAALLRLNEFPQNLALGTLKKVCPANPNSVKVMQNIGRFT